MSCVKLNFGTTPSKDESVRDRFKKGFEFPNDTDRMVECEPFGNFLDSTLLGSSGLTMLESPRQHLNSQIHEYFANIFQGVQPSSDCENSVKAFMQNIITEVYNLVNAFYFHQHLKYLKTIMIWVERNAPSAFAFKYDPLEGTQDKFSMIYEDRAAEILSVPKNFSVFLFNLIPLWNLKIWIKAGTIPLWLTDLTTNITSTVLELDIGCPVFYKFYQSIKMDNGAHQISDEQFEAVCLHLNCVSAQLTKHVTETESLRRCIEFRHLFGNLGTYAGNATNFIYERKGNNIACEFVSLSNGAENHIKMPSWNWKYFPLVRFLILVYNTRLYVHVFGSTSSDEFDGTGDLFEIFKRICDDLHPNIEK